MTETFHHRSTLKQSNKPFKSKHATKASLKEAAKGRITRPSPKSSPTSNAVAQSKLNRRNHAKQVQTHKRHEIVSATRIFNGVDGAPRIVAVVPLCEDISAKVIVQSVAKALDVDASDCPTTGQWKMRAERFRTSLQFILLPYGSFYSTLDACKASDYTLFLLSPTVEVTPWGDTLLRSLQAQGLSDCVAISAPAPSNFDSKDRAAVQKSLLSFMQYFVPDVSRMWDAGVDGDKLGVIRALAEGRPKDVKWREGRAWVVGENVELTGGEDGKGELKVTGVVRGAQLSANRLVHLPNFGDFQISKIISAPLPRTSKTGVAPMEVEPALLAEPTDDLDSLVSSAAPDDLANEQTWPTEAEMDTEMQDADTAPSIPDAKIGTTPRAVKKVPRGWSEYQAAWIVDEEDGVEDNGLGGDSDDSAKGLDGEEEEDLVDMPLAGDDADADMESGVRFEEPDQEEDEAQLAKWRLREREEKDDLAFPDEVDTPQDIPARVRFQRYRGLQSMRTSPWDPYENLPRDYARIFQFEDFKRTERSVKRRAEAEEGAVEPGTRVTICLKDVPRGVLAVKNGLPVVLFGLMQHEHKKTVLNFKVQRNTEYGGSVRSKDPLTLCVGPLRLEVKPIYSQHTRGGGKGPNNVHKFERYLRHGVTTVATVFAPVVFGHQPCFLLRETSDPQGVVDCSRPGYIDVAPELVAMGSFLNPDTTRIIAKRIVLTGHPFKVHKKTATVRYMFFNSDDVQYFKPIQLHTKLGRAGHIKESLGTHGYMKVHFDGPVNQLDTVCMNLYKRVYPRWSKLWVESDAGGGAIGQTGREVAPPSDAMEE